MPSQNTNRYGNENEEALRRSGSGEVRERREGVTGAVLKWVAVITMIIDHVTACFLMNARGSSGRALMYDIPHGVAVYYFFRGVGRLAFPIFCFLLVEGYVHTRSRRRYITRLLIFAALSEIPFKLVFFPNSRNLHLDTLFTLSLGFAAIWIIDELWNYCFGERGRWHQRAKEGLQRDQVRGHSGRSDGRSGAVSGRQAAGDRTTADVAASQTEGAESDRFVSQSEKVRPGTVALFVAGAAAAVAAAGVTAEMTGCDYSYGGVCLIVLFYVLWRSRTLSCTIPWMWITIYNSFEMWSFPSFILIRCYNGKKGRQAKYFFYIFYPAHLLVLYVLRRIIFGM